MFDNYWRSSCLNFWSWCSFFWFFLSGTFLLIISFLHGSHFFSLFLLSCINLFRLKSPDHFSFLQISFDFIYLILFYPSYSLFFLELNVSYFLYFLYFNNFSCLFHHSPGILTMNYQWYHFNNFVFESVNFSH
jgi:hypothetical protein